MFQVDLNQTLPLALSLSHINEKHISELHIDEYLDKFDFESYGRCELCLIGKMTKASFT